MPIARKPVPSRSRSLEVTSPESAHLILPTSEPVTQTSANPIVPKKEAEAHTVKVATLGADSEKPVHTRRNILQSWKWELLIWMLATSIIGTLLTLFGIYNDRPQSDFESQVQLTTIVAIAATGAQSALLFPISACLGQLKWLRLRTKKPLMDLQKFDDASRGPWGSMLMLCQSQSGWLATFAALATLLMLSLSAFAQQTVQISNRWIEEDGGSIQRIVSYGTENLNEASGQMRLTNIQSGTLSSGVIFMFSGVDAPMVSAISAGLLSPGADPSLVAGDCPTSNCTWSSYTSLAICSSVRDITSKIKTDEDEDGRTTYGIQNYYMTPYMANMSNGELVQIGSSGSYPGNNDPNDPANLVRFDIMFFKDVLKSGSDVADIDPHRDLAAFEGRLDICLQTFNSSTVNATTTTTLLKTYRASELEVSFNGSTTSNAGLYELLKLRIPDDPYEEEYVVSQAAMATFTNYMPLLIFWGWSLPPQGDGTGQTTYDEETGTLRFSDTFQFTYVNEATRGFTDALYNGEPQVEGNGQAGLEARLANLATSMTNSLRSSSSAPTAVGGVAAILVPYVRMNFLWMIPPVVLDVSTLVLIICTVFVTKRRQVPAWKSSQLAVLFARNEGGQEACLVPDVELLEKSARLQHVRLGMVKNDLGKGHVGERWELAFEA